MSIDVDKVCVAYNAIPTELIARVVSYAKTQSQVQTNHTLWEENVIGVSGPIYLISLEDNLVEEIRHAIDATFPTFNILKYEMRCKYTLGGRYSFIPWHSDLGHKLAVTVYLNEVWDLDWAGCLLYKEESSGEIKAIYPEFNKAVLINTPVQHTTVMPNIQAPLRTSLQLFFK